MSNSESLSVQSKQQRATGIGVLPYRWWAVVRHPHVSTFNSLQATARWPLVWWSLVLLASVEALAIVFTTYGPTAASGYSSLPIGPKLHLPQTPALPLVAFFGSIAQFFIFAGLLYVSARLFGGRGSFKTQAYLLSLVWVPLLLVSDLVELIPAPVAPQILGMLIRLYALCLCAVVLASAHNFRLARAWDALLVPVGAGLLIGVTVSVAFGAQIVALVK